MQSRHKEQIERLGAQIINCNDVCLTVKLKSGWELPYPKFISGYTTRHEQDIAFERITEIDGMGKNENAG